MSLMSSDRSGSGAAAPALRNYGYEPGVYGDDHPAPLEATLSSVIALRVKEARQRKGLPIRTLSERTGISKGMLSKIENAQVSPSLATLARLAEALDAPLTSFFRGFDEERDAVFVKAGHGAEIVREGKIGRASCRERVSCCV